MSAETKRVFDQLTEDAMRLMEENGGYSKCVYCEAFLFKSLKYTCLIFCLNLCMCYAYPS